jgi:hypothetical protein
MNISRFVANLNEARKTALIVVTAKNDIAREIASDSLDANVENMLEELNTISHDHTQCHTVAKIDKDALLKSLLEDAEEQNQWST